MKHTLIDNNFPNYNVDEKIRCSLNNVNIKQFKYNIASTSTKRTNFLYCKQNRSLRKVNK